MDKSLEDGAVAMRSTLGALAGQAKRADETAARIKKAAAERAAIIETEMDGIRMKAGLDDAGLGKLEDRLVERQRLQRILGAPS